MEERKKPDMPRVGIVMGSDSDMPVMAKAADILEELGISYEMAIISAHREPDVFFEYAKKAEEKGFKVIIGHGRSSAGNVRRDLSHACHRNPHAYFFSGRKRFSVFHCADAFRHSGGYGGHRRGSQCRPSGG